MYLVLIETSGNQGYIFSTNKLKENIGASESTYQAGTKWVLQAIAEVTSQTSLEVWRDSKRLRTQLKNSELNPPVKDTGTSVEIITAASGKSLFLTPVKDDAEAIIGAVTRKALIEAPGLTVSGVFVKVSNWPNDGALAAAIKTVHQEFEQARSYLPTTSSRFQTIPIVAACAASGLPASGLEKRNKAQQKEGRRARPISAVSAVKRNASNDAKERLRDLDERLSSQIDQILNEDSDTDQKSWLAIVHADGNGLGQIFLNFEQYIGSDKGNRNYINKYRAFSLALDECTEAAFKHALDVFPDEGTSTNESTAPIVPLIIGGDDLTVVCDGHYALEFTRVFLQAFEAETGKHQSITAISQSAFGVGHLSACAGVAIIKRHFPFSVAYTLAEQLIKSAKEVKRIVTCKVKDDIAENTPYPCSAIDFHVLYDTRGIDLKEIHKNLTPEPNTQLFHRPYVVSDLEQFREAEGWDWVQDHPWQRLSDRVGWLKGEGSETSDLALLSNSQKHALRAAMFLEGEAKAATDAQYALIQQRYDLSLFAESKQSLFHQNTEGIETTTFLDALEVVDFFKNAQTTSDEANVSPEERN